jgi:hypothetical protein
MTAYRAVWKINQSLPDLDTRNGRRHAKINEIEVEKDFIYCPGISLAGLSRLGRISPGFSWAGDSIFA